MATVTCPAGDPIGETRTVGGPGCRCRVEHNTVSQRRDPTSYSVYCTLLYTECPTWQADKERTWAAEQPLVDKREGE